jgi:hypothetical protein
VVVVDYAGFRNYERYLDMASSVNFAALLSITRV